MANYIVIPARLGGKRLPDKLLLDKTGKTLLQHTWENCLKVPHIKQVIVATDSKEIEEACDAFGATVHFNDEPTSCGTDRVVRTAKSLEDCDVVVNVQGEWPDVDPDDVYKTIDAVSLILDEPAAGSLYYRDEAEVNYDRVKVVINSIGDALYFSRESIPHNSEKLLYHIGVYSLNRGMIKMYDWAIEQRCGSFDSLKYEDLEQLKILNAGFPIHMRFAHRTAGVDTPELYEAFQEHLDMQNVQP